MNTREKAGAIRRFAPLLPYLAVGVGLWALRSAWAALLGYHVGMCALLTLERQWDRIRDLLQGGNARAAGAAVLTGSAAGLTLYAAGPLLGLPLGFGAALGRLGLNAATWPAFVLYFAAVNPWLEEIYWRGYLGDSSPSPAWTDLWFAGYHPVVLAGFVGLPWIPIVLVVLFGAAWILRQLARRHRGLRIPALGHLAADLSIILAIFRLSAG